jgi:hypothetical protein
MLQFVARQLRCNSRLVKVVSVKFAVRPLLCAVLCETIKQAVNLSVHQRFLRHVHCNTERTGGHPEGEYPGPHLSKEYF